MAVRDHYRAGGFGGMENGDQIAHIDLHRVMGGGGRSARLAVPPPIDGDHPIMTREVRNQPFP
jgi:hypothetical protein